MQLHVRSHQPVLALPGPLGRMALRDVVGGVRASHLWLHLAWYDIRRRYRRSTLGPLWITISMGAMIGALGFLYTRLFHQEVSDYLPFLAAGFIVWGLLAGMINEGSSVFIDASHIIKRVRLPLTIQVLRMVWRNLIIFFHNIAILVVVIMIFSRSPGWGVLLALPALLLLAINGLWIGLLLGTISARFRDVPPTIGSVLQIGFFMTPIIWKPGMRDDLSTFVSLNPLHHLVTILRGPLLGDSPELGNWLAVCGITLAGSIITFLVFRSYRNRIAYWE